MSLDNRPLVALTLRCKVCGAEPGEECRTPSGRPTKLHMAREDRAAQVLERNGL